MLILERLLKWLVLLLSGYLALGSFDLFFGEDAALGTMQLLIILFVALVGLVHAKSLLHSLLQIGPVSILLLIVVFGLSQSIYGESMYGAALLNFKLLVCVVFYASLVVFFKAYPLYVYFSLISFVLTAIFYSIFVLYGTSEAFIVHKGQLIVLGENPNSTSSRLAIAYILLLSYFFQRRSHRVIWHAGLFIISLPVLELIVKSGSRGSLLAVVGSLVLFIWLAKTQLRLKLAIVALAIVGAPLFIEYLLTSENLAERWLMAAAGDTAGRTDIWKDALSIFLQNPIIGIGEGGYFQEIYGLHGQFIDTHNLFLYLAVCGGIFSLILFVVFLFPIVKRSLLSFKTGDALPLILLVNIIFIASKTGGVITYALMWYVFAVVYSYRNSLGQNK